MPEEQQIVVSILNLKRKESEKNAARKFNAILCAGALFCAYFLVCNGENMMP